MVLALIPLVPALGALITGVVGIRWFSRGVSAVVASATMAAAFILSVVSFVRLLALPADARVQEYVLAAWIPDIPLATVQGQAAFGADWAFRLDPLSAVMILVVTGIGFLIHVYSIAYMQEEPAPAYARYFCYLNLFCAFMLVLVLGANFLVMFVGWEGVGLCSYLLIGFWYEKESAADAGRKAFITNRIGDWGFLLGVFFVFFVFGTLDFREVAARAAALPVETGFTFGALTVMCLLLFAGATGKSAQIPLFVWLPDAMAGPTPVSALIHAATMVTAGVYMVARTAVLFSHAPLVLAVVAVVGAATALIAATIALVQTDIKRVLAYSTVSQLGLMFLATGVGAFAAAIFHLMTHAFFKALLFLGSGSVIHAMAGEQDVRRMGGLRRYLPVTSAVMFVGMLAIAGIPPLSGFFSKDEILYRTFLGGALSANVARVLWFAALGTSLLTAYYMARLMVLTFSGSYRGPAWSFAASPAATEEAAVHGVPHPRDPHAHGQAQRVGHEVTHGAADVVTSPVHTPVWHGPHEAPRTMTWPLMALAAGAIAAGFAGVPAALGGTNAIEHFLAPSLAAPHAMGSADVPAATPAAAGHGSEAVHLSRTGELGLMLISVAIAAAGLLAARHVHLTRPELAAGFVARWPRVHRMLSHAYYVDEIYGATFIQATWSSASGLWRFDRHVVDGAVNASGWATQAAAWMSHMLDKYVVDGLVNALAALAGAGSHALRRLQSGLIQNYALMMIAGLFVLLTLYLLGTLQIR